MIMAKSSARAASPAIDTEVAGGVSARILELEALAQRRALFDAHAAAARQVAVYRSSSPPGAKVPAVGSGGPPRDAQDQLHLILAMTGGAIAKAPGELCVRVPAQAAERFEALARPLIEAHLVAFRR
ncbi:hypothetical protein BH10PSE3_BH10PSE3_04270 [soil metagenome]